MNNNTKNEGLWDRLSAGWTGVKTAASNIGATAAGTPAKITSVEDAKINQLFKLVQSRMKPFFRNLKSNNILTKTNAEIEVKKQLIGFLNDFMKMTGVKKPNDVITSLQDPKYKPIADYLKNIGVSVPSSSTKTPASTKKSSSVPSSSTKPVKATTKKPSQAPTKKSGSTPASPVGRRIPEGKTKIGYKEFFV